MTDKEKLSICKDAEALVGVLSYNQAAYIRQCLDSIFMQQCEFKFAVLVFDDVSTDNSWEIINEYHEKYDNLFIYQPAHNMYSQGVYNTFAKCLFSADGFKYIAICEADDYWSDPHKLQKQYEAMEREQSCSICVCATDTYDERKKCFVGRAPESQGKDIIFPKEKVIIDTLRSGCYYGANTYFLRAGAACKIDLDSKFWECAATDMCIILSWALQGEVLYLDKCMAVKRRNNSGSMSGGKEEVKPEQKIQAFTKDISWVLNYNEMSSHKFEAAVQRYILWRNIRMIYIREGQTELERYVNSSNGKAYKSELLRKINRWKIRMATLLYKDNIMGYAAQEHRWMKKEWKRIIRCRK